MGSYPWETGATTRAPLSRGRLKGTAIGCGASQGTRTRASSTRESPTAEGCSGPSLDPFTKEALTKEGKKVSSIFPQVHNSL